MFTCADKIAEIDRQMQDMYQRIKAAESASAEEGLRFRAENAHIRI